MAVDKFELLMDYLAKAEGVTVHRNSTETDITSPYGVYRVSHPKADIFTLVDAAARAVGVTTSSDKWTKSQIDLVNKELDKYKTEVREFAKSFYISFLKPARAELFPAECMLAIFSMYVNSPANAIRAVQNSLIEMRDTGSFHFTGVLSTEDGVMGGKTENALKDIAKENISYLNYYLEALMLSNMKSIYVNLALVNPDNISINDWDFGLS